MKHFTKIAACLLISCVLNSCKKDPVVKKDDPVNAPTQAMFWITSDLGCGNIAVTCNGTTKNITGYYASLPACGSPSSATFDLQPGTYNYTAQCSSLTWSGTITVTGGQCNSLKLTSSGSSGGGAGTGTTATVTTPNTMFLSAQDYTVSTNGSYWTQQFTLSASTALVLRFTAQYQAQAAIILPGQLANFQSNNSFTGYAVFDKQIGTTPVTLAAGTYYLAVRNSTNGPNKWSVELDKDISLPASDRAVFIDNYISGVKSFTAGSQYWHPFTVQNGYRYFLDGCNVNCDVRIIPANQLAAFQNNQTYQYYTDYYTGTGSAPGLDEIKLPAGDYYMVSYNNAIGSLTYTMERWKVN